METPRRVGPSGANHMRLFSALAPALFSGVYTPTQCTTGGDARAAEHGAGALGTDFAHAIALKTRRMLYRPSLVEMPGRWASGPCRWLPLQR